MAIRTAENMRPAAGERLRFEMARTKRPRSQCRFTAARTRSKLPHRARTASRLRQQQFEIFAPKVTNQGVVFSDDGVRERTFGLLKFQHLLFDCIASDQPIGEH